ncbi:MAG: HAD family phosphatase [Treponema sp.]|nr:HAD family phosphatase [Candidatus Treponema caballi]
MTERVYSAVVFDMDGVIFDSERATFNCWVELAAKYGIPDIEIPYRDCIGVNAARTREICLAYYGSDFPYEKYQAETSRMFHEKYDGGRLPLKPGVVELLSFLKEGGKKVALASSTKRERVMQLLSDADLLKFFDAVVCGDMVTHSKPHPEIFLKACQELGVESPDAYAIEDSYNGIRAAASGKLRALMVPDMLPATDEMHELAEDVLPSLVEVKEYLK